MPKLTPHQNRIMQMEPIYKAQTTMLQWLRQEMPPRPLGKVAMRYVGRPCPYCGVEDALAGDRNAALHTYWTRNFPDRKSGPNEQVPRHGRLRENFVRQFTELVQTLSRYQVDLWNLHIDYFDRKPDPPMVSGNLPA